MWLFRESREAERRNPREGWPWHGGTLYKIDGAIPHDIPPAGNLALSSPFENRSDTATTKSNQIRDLRNPSEAFIPARPMGGISTLSEMPKTESEAKEHIEAIRNQKKVDNLDRNVKDLEAALQLISNNLYQKSMHFIVELIQNADDSTYTNGTKPEMRITYEEGTLRFDTTRSASKANSRGRRIGEKGIGFKSVFKVSDEVFISSGHYSFMFSSHAPLGRLSPVWATFPGSHLPGFTSIFLRLSRTWDSIKIIEELKGLDGRLLMFLRNLETVAINIHELGGTSSIMLKRENKVTERNNLQVLSLYPDPFSPYLRFRFLVSDLPHDVKREGHYQSEILLAFPSNTIYTTGGMENIISQETHQVYAYLPIRNYGFNFVLQADFVLVANREDIESESPWNQALAHHIPCAILAAIDRLNDGEHRFSWLRHVPFKDDRDDFFRGIGPTTMQLLSQRRILESVNGILMLPSELALSPDAFADSNGNPLIPQEDSIFVYISQKYSREASHALRLLGVKYISAEEFLDDLESFIGTRENKFQAMPIEWHATLCEALDSLYIEHESRISTLRVIPLQNGEWISRNESSNGSLLLSEPTSKMYIPRGIQIFEVRHDITNKAQIGFLRKLRAQDTAVGNICQIILETHASKEFNPEKINATDLVSHVAFLQEAGWRVPESQQTMWVLTQDGRVCRSSEVYMASEQPHSASKLSSKCDENHEFYFLNRQYAENQVGIATAEDQKEWLEVNLNIAQLPRLISHANQNKGGFVMNKDFDILMDQCPMSVLQLLRCHWDYYRIWILKDDSRKADTEEGTHAETPHSQLRNKISSMTVLCHGLSMVKLHETYLARRSVLVGFGICSKSELMTVPGSMEIPSPQVDHLSITKNSFESCTEKHPSETRPWQGMLGTLNHDSFPLLAVEDPEEKSWNFLEVFGVTIQPTVRNAIGRLKQLFHTNAKKEQVIVLYDQIQLLASEEDSGFIRQAFQTNALLFVPLENNGVTGAFQWLSSDDCVWEGPSFLKKIPRLSHHYPNHKWLFNNKLGIPHARLETIVSEARQIVTFDSLEYIREVFLGLCNMTKGASVLEIMESGCDGLKRLPIFPIWTERHDSGSFCLRNALYADDGSSWYLADVPCLLNSFSGHIHLLAFDPLTLQSMNWLTDVLLGSRKLSKIATKTLTVQGVEKLDERLIPATNPHRDSIKTQLQGVKVYQSAQVSISWKFNTRDGKAILGTLEEGRVMLATESQPLKVYLIPEDTEIGRPPLELTQELSRFCGLEKFEHISFLTHILIQKDNRRIERDFQTHGIFSDIIDVSFATPSTLAQKNVDIWQETNESNQTDQTKEENTQHAIELPTLMVDNKSLQKDEDGIDPFVECIPLRIYEGGSGSHRKPRLRLSHEPPRRHGLMSLSMPVNWVDTGNTNEEGRFAAELLVSNFLQSILQKEYHPLRHWTSSLRKRAGHKMYQTTDSSVSTFTVKDENGRLRRFLSKEGYEHAWALPGSPTFHIQVALSGSSINSRFDLSPEQVKKAKKFTLSEEINSTLDNFCILALVYQRDNSPEVALFPDPWRLHCNGSLCLEIIGEYEGQFEDESPAIYLDSNLIFSHIKEDSAPKHLEYRQLDQGHIRVLALSPGDTDSPLTGEIRYVSLDSPGSFIALSYVWGTSPTLTSAAYLKTSEGRITFPPSLGDALRAVREAKVPILIWADSICINQADTSEKVMQIRLMGKIFQAAERVIAWLGHEYDDSQKVIETLTHIWSISQPANANALSMDHVHPVPDTWANNKFPSWSDIIWHRIDSFLDRDWFKRAWIVQELVLPSRVYLICGNSMMEWDHFFEALKICEREVNSGTSLDPSQMKVLPHAGPAYALGLTRQKLKDEAKRYSLLNLLELFAHTQATILQDKLFALLGLAFDSWKEDFTPDYDSSIEEVVRRYASSFVLDGRVLDLLYRAGSAKSYEFCSWIPDWTRETFPQTISTWEAVGGRFYAGQRIPSMAKNPIPAILAIKGFSVDFIISTSSIRMGTRNILSFVEAMADFRRLTQCVLHYPTGETQDQVLLRLPIGNAKRPHLESTIDKLRLYRDFAQTLAEGDINEKWPDNLGDLVFSISLDKEANEFFKLPVESQIIITKYWQTAAAFANRICGSNFGVTKEHYVALLPAAAKVGDEICLLHGAAVPFVIRGNSMLIGECYVHGIMNGELLHRKLVEKTFFLK